MRSKSDGAGLSLECAACASHACTPPSVEFPMVLARPEHPPIAQYLKCSVNHFQLRLQVPSIFQYHVAIEPDIQRISARRRMMEKFRDLWGQFIYDGRALLFSTKETASQVVHATYAKQEYTITVLAVASLDGKNNQGNYQAYNLLCHQVLENLTHTHLGRHHFQPHSAVRIPQHHLEIWPGFFTSVRNTMAGITLCLDVAHKVIRTDSVLGMINDCLQKPHGRALVNELLEGQVVLTRYNNKTYRVDHVVWDMSPLSSFEQRRGEKMTFVQYYQSMYSLAIRDHRQPLLVHHDRRTKLSIYLVPELCNLTGMNDQMRQDCKCMRDMAKHTRVPPAERNQRLRDFIEDINQSRVVQDTLSEWKMQIRQTPLLVQGRPLPCQQVCTQHNHVVSAGPRAEWFVNSVVEPVTVANWLLIYPSNTTREADILLRQMEREAKKLGIRMVEPKRISIAQDAPELYQSAIVKHYHRHVELVVCMLKFKEPQSYHRVKQVCCHELGVTSQCVMARSVGGKNLGTIASKIVQQINSKMGGDLWRLRIPLQETMIVGIDVHHDAGGDNGRGIRSVVGFCASTNKHCTKYFSTVKFQDAGQEIIDQLAECFEEAFENYHQINRAYPSCVIVYRDGVGDGQFGEVLDFELPQMQQVISDKSPGTKLTLVLVQKRIHLRIFDHSHDLLCPHNAPPGTVIDTACVSADSYDFYLVNQHVRDDHGTVTPTHYHVIYDEVQLRPDRLQILTFKLGHLYFNWNGAIRVPAPCQYAHKIAFLVGQSVHENPHANLSNRLHFL